MQKKLNEDFIDSYCEKFAGEVTNGFFTGEKESISGQEILEATPSVQTNFFVLKLIFQYWQGESRKLESPFFNYKSDGVQLALAEFMNVLSRNIEIHKNRFQLLLNHAVKDAIYLAASPHAYLEIDLDTAEVDKIDDQFVEDSTRYLKIYKTEIKNFLSDMRGLSPEDAIDELDDEFEEFNTDTGLAQETEILSQVVPIKPDQVVVDKLPDDFDEFEDEIFDNDEQLKEIEAAEREKAEAEKQDASPPESPAGPADLPPEPEPVPDIPAESVGNFEAEDIPEEMPSDEAVAEEPIVEPKVKEETVEEEPEPIVEEPRTAESEIAEAAPAVAEEEPQMQEPPKEVEEENLTEEESLPKPPQVAEEEPEGESSEEPKEEEVAETINDQFEPEPSVAEHHEETRTGSLMQLISINHQHMFVKELFQDDQVSFQNALYDLEEYNSFDEAVEFLVQGYAKEFSWDMQSNEVKELLKVLFRKYRDS